MAATEWREVKALRLEALADPNAALAFLDTVERASAEPDEFWQQRTVMGAEGGPNAQFVLIDDAGEWVGSATALLLAGPLRVSVVGVYVAPRARAKGGIDALLDACADFARSNGFRHIELSAHVDNERARRAYQRNGFDLTGVTFETVIGTETEMIRTL